MLSNPYIAWDTIQGYGGAAAIVYDDVIYFSNDSGDTSNPDNGIYSRSSSRMNQPLFVGSRQVITHTTHETPLAQRLSSIVDPEWRYANFAVHSTQPTCWSLYAKTPSSTNRKASSIRSASSMRTAVLIDGTDFYTARVKEMGLFYLQVYLFFSKTGGEASGGYVVWKLCLGEGHHWHFVSAIKDVL